MILCPVKGKPVFTGIATSEEAFETSTLRDNTVGNCHLCGLSHKWNKKDAFLEGSRAPSISSEASPRL